MEEVEVFVETLEVPLLRDIVLSTLLEVLDLLPDGRGLLVLGFSYVAVEPIYLCFRPSAKEMFSLGRMKSLSRRSGMLKSLGARMLACRQRVPEKRDAWLGKCLPNSVVARYKKRHVGLSFRPPGCVIADVRVCTTENARVSR